MDLINRLFAGDLMYVSVLIVVFAGVLALALGIRYLLIGRTNVVKQRLRRAVGGTPAVAEDTGAEGERNSLLQVALSPFARIAKPTSQDELSRVRANLSHAGFRSERALVNFLGAKVVLSVGFGLLILYLNAHRPQPMRYAALVTILVMFIGLYAPNAWLMGRIKERQSKINKALPDALDLLVTCVEAGLGLDAAIARVSSEIQLSAPLLSREMAEAALEMRAGIGRGEAFKRLADRTGVEELRNLSAIIMQTQIFGTSVAKSLRVQAEAMRVRRMQLAEERAATASVKMTFPLILCILPCLFAVLLGPAVVSIVRILLPKLAGE